MADLQDPGGKRPLRAQLKAGTHAVHDRLDRSVGALDLTRPGDYARFLARQLAAREPIEEWADRHCPALLRPPSMAFLLRADLAELGGLPPAPDRSDPAACFALPVGADPLGLAWAIAGSNMGNQMILVRLRKAVAAGRAPPMAGRFLEDTRMTAFWHRLLPRLQEPVSPSRAEPALAAARAVFARFEQAFTADETGRRQAA